MKKSFQGVAFWTISTQERDWIGRALRVLEPVETAGLGILGYEPLPAGDQLTVAFDDDETHQLLLNGGAGRGLVRQTRTAGAFVVCLLALRKSIGDIDIVDDNQDVVPTLPRQSYPLFKEDWEKVVAIAQVVGLVPSKQFASRHGAVLNRMF